MSLIPAFALVAVLVIAGTLLGAPALVVFRLIRSGKPVPRFSDVRRRAKQEAVVVVGQSKLLYRVVPGLVHAAIFWGFLVLFPTIVIAMIGAVDSHSPLPWLSGAGGRP